MEAIKRQASKFREQVSKQQQALLRQLGHSNAEGFVLDEAETSCRDHLHNLHTSTRAAKHFEKDIAHSIEGIVSVTSKQIEIDRRFAEDCKRYEAENHCSTSPLAEVASLIGTSRNSMIEEKRTLIEVFSEKVCKPLRALVRSAELEDARLLVRRYDKLWQEVESQAGEVLRLRSKPTEGAKSEENFIKLQLAEERLDDLKARLTALGKEATSAMLSVETHQQKMTFQQLVIMLNAERSYHRNVLSVLEKLLDEMIQLEQLSEASLSEDATQSHTNDIKIGRYADSNNGNKEHCIEYDSSCYVAKVVHPFDSEGEDELSLRAGDIIVVKQDSNHGHHCGMGSLVPLSQEVLGEIFFSCYSFQFIIRVYGNNISIVLMIGVITGGWSKGECNGRTGWFPTPYVQRLDEVSEGNVTWANL